VFVKLLTLIVGIGLVAGALLATRQARIQAAHDLADLRLMHARQDHELLRLRARIAALVTPEHVRRMAAHLGPLKQIEPAHALALARRELERTPPPEARPDQ
jgi:hypothetical protein